MKNYEISYINYIKATKEEFNGFCDVLALETINWLNSCNIKANFMDIWSYPNPKYGLVPKGISTIWNFHAVVIIENYVHDMWVERPMIIEDYLFYMFGDVEVQLRMGIVPKQLHQIWQGKNLLHESINTDFNNDLYDDIDDIEEYNEKL